MHVESGSVLYIAEPRTAARKNHFSMMPACMNGVADVIAATPAAVSVRGYPQLSARSRRSSRS